MADGARQQAAWQRNRQQQRQPGEALLWRGGGGRAEHQQQDGEKEGEYARLLAVRQRQSGAGEVEPEEEGREQKQQRGVRGIGRMDVGLRGPDVGMDELRRDAGEEGGQ